MVDVAQIAALGRKFPSFVDLEQQARRRLPKFAFDYMSGGAGDESGVTRNRKIYQSIRFVPKYLEPRQPVQVATECLGGNFDQPFGIAPIGLSGLMWPGSAEFLAAAAAKANIPFSLSTFATTDIETIGKIAGVNSWFQLYPIRDDNIQFDLLDRAKAAGFSALIVTVDTPGGRRTLRDMRNGLAVPPKLTVGNFASIFGHPSWALSTLTKGPPKFESILRYLPQNAGRTNVTQLSETLLMKGVDWEFFAKLRDRWKAPMAIKGPLSVSDAERCRRIGVDAIVLSNHGGRQSESLPHPLLALPEIRDAVGSDLTLIVDSGVRSGLDVARALAVGADFVLLGRAFMFAVAALGEAGAELAAELLRAELAQILEQIGCFSLRELPDYVASMDDIGNVK